MISAEILIDANQNSFKLEKLRFFVRKNKFLRTKMLW